MKPRYTTVKTLEKEFGESLRTANILTIELVQEIKLWRRMLLDLIVAATGKADEKVQ